MGNRAALRRVGDVGLGEDEGPAGDADHPFVRAAAGVGGEVAGGGGDVDADHGEVAGLEFEDVGAPFQSGRGQPARMRIGTKTTNEHVPTIAIVMSIVNQLFWYPILMRIDQHCDRVSARVIQSLRAERLRQGVSMTLLAQKAGLSQGMISLVEHGLRHPTLDTLLRMSAALQLELGSIISRAATEAELPEPPKPSTSKSKPS